MEQIICLAMGYVFGLFQTGFIYGRSKGIDIRQHGSGNSGSTNAPVSYTHLDVYKRQHLYHVQQRLSLFTPESGGGAGKPGSVSVP